MSFQVKVEYSPEKFISFFVDVVTVFSGQYTYLDLVEDIVSRCPSLSYLNASNIRIRYEDDEGSLINLHYGDDMGFQEMWNNAKPVLEREYRRIKIKASEIDSPLCRSAKNTSHKGASRMPTETNSRKRLELNFDQESSSNIFTNDMQTNQIPNNKTFAVKTPLERLFDKMEKDIEATTKNIETKRVELQDFENDLREARQNNTGNLQVCGKCHLREGHTKRNCELGECLSAKACGLIEKHPEEKGRKRKLESDIASEITSLNKLQENYRKKKISYNKISDSFSSKVEKPLIESNPSLYVNNGCKNWLLINKHASILEKKCNGRLPRTSEIPGLLKDMPNESQRKQIHHTNPHKDVLQENYGIIFPTTSNLDHTRAVQWPTILPPHFSSQQEKDDFYYARALQLQDMQSQQPSNSYPSTATSTSTSTSTFTSTRSETLTNPLDMLALAAASKESQ